MAYLRLRWVGAGLVTLACGGPAFEGFNDDPGDAGGSGTTSGGSAAGGRSGAGGTTAVAGASSAGRASAGRDGQGGATTTAGSSSDGGATDDGGSGGTITNPGAGRGGSGRGGAGAAGSGGTATSGGASQTGGVGGVAVGGGAGSGGTGPDARCPDRMPQSDVECRADDLVCHYDARGCLCSLATSLLCAPVDPECGGPSTEFAAPPAGGTSGRVVPVASYTICECASSGMGSGSWECTVTP